MSADDDRFSQLPLLCRQLIVAQLDDKALAAVVQASYLLGETVCMHLIMQHAWTRAPWSSVRSADDESESETESSDGKWVWRNRFNNGALGRTM